MGKKATKNAEDKARRKVLRAQLDLHTAQEKRAVALTRGERAVEVAKQQAAKWQAKATERVERSAGVLAQAEAQLLTATSRRQKKSSPRLPRSAREQTREQKGTSQAPQAAPTPEIVADILARNAHLNNHSDGPIILPGQTDSVQENTGGPSPEIHGAEGEWY